MSRVTHEPAAAAQRLAEASRALVTTHRSPDGDALGSELAIAELARGLGTEVTIVNRDPAPAGLLQLPGSEIIHVAAELPENLLTEFDLVVTMECPGLERPGFSGLDRLPILNIDHHLANQQYGELNYVDEESPAVGEMVWRMFTAVNRPPSADAATNMFVALSTDTGDFRYSNATPRAFHAAGEMVAAGARPEQVAGWVHEQHSASSIRLLSEALKTLRLTCDGRLAIITVDQDAFRRAGATQSDTEDIVNVPRAIADVRVVAFLKQWTPDAVRVSLRSKDRIDVRSVAVAFGGGGHTNAAGCTIEGNLSTALELLTFRLKELLECDS